ncbi:Type II secretory pathway, component PulF [Thauera aromatica K172]|uniref:Type II secretory pathway, component PulF n=2 Tax=Thauera aromatica TaxID=59405 RepID=A0A2R4BJS9_THAAR|nr:Type II secretory pathway, component PulF [Thauera aromatica K172]
MLKLGEHTGALDRALDNVATLYRRDVSDSIARLQAAAEPALTLLMGGLLLWIASAVLGPIYALSSHLPG